MPNFDSENRAPLELTKPSKIKNIVVVCPNCHTARYVGKNWWGCICGCCNNYFNKEQSLNESEAKNWLSEGLIISPEYLNFRKEMEEKAYAYKENVMDKRKSGTSLSHEPDDVIKKTEELKKKGLI